MAIKLSVTMPIGSSSFNTRRSVQPPPQQPNRRQILLLPSLDHHRKLPQISNINTILRCSKNPSYGGGGGNSGGRSGWGRGGSSGDDDGGRSKHTGIRSLVLFDDVFFYEDGKTLRFPFTGKFWIGDALFLFFSIWLFDMKTRFFSDYFNALMAEAERSKDDDGWSELPKWRQTKRTT